MPDAMGDRVQILSRQQHEEISGRAEGRNRTKSEEKALTKSYYPCVNCKRHPQYPTIPAVTLHIEGICALCGTYSGVK